MPVKKKFLIVGHPRGGTGYMSKLLQAYGYSVGHEKILADGTSSWMHVVDTPDTPFGEPRGGILYEHVIHVVRHPITTVSSMVGAILETQAKPESIKFMSKFIDVKANNNIELAVKTYIQWHQLAAQCQPRLRLQVENAALELPGFLKDYDCPYKVVTRLPPKNYNSRKHATLTWGDVRDNVPTALHKQLVTLARFFGYGKKKS